jgi:hypothetical protein
MCSETPQVISDSGDLARLVDLVPDQPDAKHFPDVDASVSVSTVFGVVGVGGEQRHFGLQESTGSWSNSTTSAAFSFLKFDPKLNG